MSKILTDEGDGDDDGDDGDNGDNDDDDGACLASKFDFAGFNKCRLECRPRWEALWSGPVECM